jgi:pimeloyl-ACP methyl ester carboxylesterase
MSVDVPLFVPTAAGAMSAMASVPESGRVRGPAVALLPGHEAERVRIDALRDIAHALAAEGQPVISFDYPGIGMSPSKALPRNEVPRVLGEACAWFLDKTGLSELALAGTCGGAALSLTIAARSPSVCAVVAQGLPLRLRRGRVKSRIRAGIAALDWVGPGVVAPLTRGSSVKYSETEWNLELVGDICAAATRARVELVFGENDRAYHDFLQLQLSERLLPEAANKLEVSVLPGAALNLLSNEEHQSWFSGIVERSLSEWAPLGAIER